MLCRRCLLRINLVPANAPAVNLVQSLVGSHLTNEETSSGVFSGAIVCALPLHFLLRC